MYTLFTKELMAVKEKKTEVITYRTTSTVKKALEQEAEARGWSISQLSERIIEAYVIEHAAAPENGPLP